MAPMQSTQLKEFLSHGQRRKKLNGILRFFPKLGSCQPFLQQCPSPILKQNGGRTNHKKQTIYLVVGNVAKN